MSFGSHFDSNRTIAFGNKKDDRFSEGKAESKPVAYAVWDEIGAEEARSTAYAQGKVDGFNNELPHAEKLAKIDGQKDEEAFFATHSVLRVKKASVKFLPGEEVDGVVPGAKLFFNLKVANHGDIASKPAAVNLNLVSTTGNVDLTHQTLVLPAIPAQTVATIEGMSGVVIGKNVKADDLIELRVSGIMPDGADQRELVTLKGEFHIKVDSDIKFDATPKRGKFMGVRKHDVVVAVTNLSKSATQEDFKVVLEGPSGIEIKEGLKVVNSLARGAKSEVTLVYKVKNKKLKGKTVTLEVKVYYGSGNKLISSKTIDVVPR
jgi:hypothetical protein